MFSYTADLLHHRPAVLCNQTYITISMLCNYRRDSFIMPITHSQQTALQKDVLFTVCVFLLVTEEFLTEQSRPRCRKQKKKKHGQRNSDEEGRGYVFSQSPLSSLFLGWSVSLTPSVISSASLLGGQALSVQYLFLFSQLSGERTRMMVPLL